MIARTIRSTFVTIRNKGPRSPTNHHKNEYGGAQVNCSPRCSVRPFLSARPAVFSAPARPSRNEALLAVPRHHIGPSCLLTCPRQILTACKFSRSHSEIYNCSVRNAYVLRAKHHKPPTPPPPTAAIVSPPTFLRAPHRLKFSYIYVLTYVHTYVRIIFCASSS